MNAIQTLLDEARNKRWCVTPRCTTCGATDYRRAILAQVEPLIDALSQADFQVLRREFQDIDVDNALRLLLMEVDARAWIRLGGDSLTRRLDGTDAGRYLAGMRQHDADLARRRAEREAYEAPETVAARRRAAAAERQARHQERDQRKKQRDEAIAAVIQSFGRLDSGESLRRIAARSHEFPLYRLPSELVTRLVGALGTVSDAALVSLRDAVPATRVTPLSILSSAIDAERKRRER